MMAEQKIILVTGGTGLLGNAIRKIAETEEKRPNERWVFLDIADGDLTDREATKALFEKYKPTHVIHLAAMVGGLFANLLSNIDFLRNNLLINDNVLHHCYEYKVKKCVSCLTTCALPDGLNCAIDETQLHDGAPHSSNYGYSYAKRLIEVQNRAYNEKKGCHFTSFLPTNIFGPHDDFNLQDSHVIPGLLHRIYHAKKENKPFVVWGTGIARRQFIYSLDLARLIIWVLREYREEAPINLVDDLKNEVTIKETVEKIVEVMDFKGEVIYDSTKPDGQIRKTASNAKLRKYRPDFKFTDMKQALKETCDWLAENHDVCRK